MIEIELKYKLENEPDLSNLQLLGEKAQIDIYYDTRNYDLIKNGNFLRNRNDKKLDFKTNLDDKTHLYCKETSFNIEDIENKQSEINQVLSAIGLPSDKKYSDLKTFLEHNDFLVLSPIKKERKSYKVEEKFTIYIDTVEDLGVFLEAEFEVDSENISEGEAQKIKNKINNFLFDNNIITDQDKAVNIGYVELYLKEHNPSVYEMGLYKE